MFFRKKPKIRKPLFRKIINAFIYAFAGFILLWLIAFGFTQTSTFREWLRETVIEEVNLSTNGKLELERLDGTIFTSIIFHNIIYTLDQDTLLRAEKLELRTSPLKIIFKIIYIRKFEISNAQISFIKDDSGVLNISKIITLEEEETVKEYETSSGFTFKFEIAELILSNVDFLIQSEEKRNSRDYYDHANFDDFRLKNVNLKMYAFADISDQEFELNIHELSVNTNLKNFELQNLSAEILLIRDEEWVKDLNLKTTSTDIDLNIAISGFNLLDEKETRKIEDAQIKLELTANNFNFDDLSTFIEGTDLLKGNISTEIRIIGSLNEMNLNQLLVAGDSTKIDGSGTLRNITGGEDMNIDVRFVDSFIDQNFANDLLHTIELPVFERLGLLRIDTLFFSGKPLNFYSGLSLSTDKGDIELTSKLDIEKEDLVYEINFTTVDFDLNPIVNIPSRLNCTGHLSGEGTLPESMHSEIVLEASGSELFGSDLNNFSLSAEVQDGRILSRIDFGMEKTNGSLSAEMIINNFDNPTYNFKTNIKGLDLSLFTLNTEMESNLNFTMTGEGENFAFESLNLFLILEVDSSIISGIEIDNTSLIADIRSDSSDKIVNLISDLADITLMGKYNLEDLVSVIEFETSVLTAGIKNKINAIQPSRLLMENANFQSAEEFILPAITEEILTSEIDISYLIEFKSFELLSLILGDSDLEVDGEISGEIKTFPDSLLVSFNADIDYFKYWDGSDLIYLSNLTLNSNLEDKLSDHAFNDFSFETELNVGRIFAGTEIESLDFNMIIKNTSADLSLSAVIDNDAMIDISGETVFDGSTLEVVLNKLKTSYNNYTLINKGMVEIIYSSNNIEFKKFKLTHNPGEIDLSGNFSFTGEEDLKLNISNFRLKEMGTKLFELPAKNSPDAAVNLYAEYKGTASSPVMDLNFSIDSLNLSGLLLGSFNGKFDYLNESINMLVDFKEQSSLIDIPKLKINGTFPINLAMNGKEILFKNRELDIKFIADKFNIQVFNAAVPMLNNLKGFLEADVNIVGTLDDVITSGNFNLKNGSFILAENNLNYNFGFDIFFQDNDVSLKNFYLANKPGTKDGGTIKASGNMTHENFIPTSGEIVLNGDLKLLGSESRMVSSTLYGELSIKTIGDVVYTFNKDRSQLSADISIKRGANITYSPIQSAFSNENDKFRYEFAKDISMLGQDRQIDSLIVVAEAQRETEGTSSEFPFDLDIKISVEDEVKAIFILSREFKQNLTAYLGGNFEYILVNQVPTAKGELTLLEGSRLEFIKTFQAEGSIQFLTEIDNPFLDITASYINYYNPDTLRSSSNEYEVLIQIKLEGPVKNLSTNFIRNEENISVYKRPAGRGQYELDATKDASDAMMFIIIGKFPEDATTQETNLAVSTAASLAGSIVGGFLNESLGDYVRSFQVSQSGSETKFNLIGKAGSFRYEIGGTSQMFQDLSRANIRIEYPIPITPGLIVRLERREPIFESSTASEMINELGLKYSFEF